MADEYLALDAFIKRHRLPSTFAATATDYYVPLAEWVERRRAAFGRAGFVLGINGAQGTGKSTLSNFLAEYLATRYARNVVELSIDDLYLTRAAREALARDVHPLLRTRGVPGTHDVALGSSVIETLQALLPGATVPVPRFDKSTDDRISRQDWPIATGPVDVIVLEGWCVGSVAQTEHDLVEPVNELEAQEDAAGTWRGYVNNQLRAQYPELFEKMDALVYLQAPNFEVIQSWRTEQEHKLRDVAAASAKGVLSDREVVRFVQHFERITRGNFRALPGTADVVIGLGEDHCANYIRFADRV